MMMMMMIVINATELRQIYRQETMIRLSNVWCTIIAKQLQQSKCNSFAIIMHQTSRRHVRERAGQGTVCRMKNVRVAMVENLLIN